LCGIGRSETLNSAATCHDVPGFTSFSILTVVVLEPSAIGVSSAAHMVIDLSRSKERARVQALVSLLKTRETARFRLRPLTSALLELFFALAYSETAQPLDVFWCVEAVSARGASSKR
jgi:hypothetical protein